MAQFLVCWMQADGDLNLLPDLYCPGLLKIVRAMPVGAGLLNAAEQSHEHED